MEIVQINNIIFIGSKTTIFSEQTSKTITCESYHLWFKLTYITLSRCERSLKPWTSWGHRRSLSALSIPSSFPIASAHIIWECKLSQNLAKMTQTQKFVAHNTKTNANINSHLIHQQASLWTVDPLHWTTNAAKSTQS